jgi:predicted DNA-binding transcriptional regulator AlpA
VLESIPYRLAVGVLLTHPDRAFTVEELERELGASRPTIYRHLNKLRDLDLLAHGDGGGEEGGAEGEGGRRRRYGLRFGSLSRAWRFTELGAECALESLRERVDVVAREAASRARGKDAGDGDNVERDFSQSRVTFRLVLKEMGPCHAGASEEDHLRELMLAIGYLSPGRAPEGEGAAAGSLPWRLFAECMLGRPDRSWTLGQLMAKLGASKPTLYRHLRKLEAMDLLEHGSMGGSPRASKGLRLRYGDLATAWNFTEEHARASLRSYRETVAHLEGLLKGAGAGGGERKD